MNHTKCVVTGEGRRSSELVVIIRMSPGEQRRRPVVIVGIWILINELHRGRRRRLRWLNMG